MNESSSDPNCFLIVSHVNVIQIVYNTEVFHDSSILDYLNSTMNFSKHIIIFYFSFFPMLAMSTTIDLYGEDNYPPFSNKEKNGLSHKVIQAAYNAVNVEVNFITMPFVRIIKMLDENQALGGFNLIKTHNIDDKYLFANSPIYVVKTYFYYLKNKPLPIKKISDLNNKAFTVGQVRGFMYEKEFLDLSFSRYEAGTEEQLVAMLASGRIDAAYITREAELYYRKKLNIAENKIDYLRDVGVYDVPLYLAFNKKHPDAKKYLKAFNEGMVIINNNGVLKKIIDTFNHELLSNIN